MKKLKKMPFVLIALMGVSLLTACQSENKKSNTRPSTVSSTQHSATTATNHSSSAAMSSSTLPKANASGSSTAEQEVSKTDSLRSPSSNGALATYSSNQIEYARVWLAYGPNQAIDELDVLEIPAGTLINPNDQTSATYPKNTIQLSGSRLVDGVVTYSSNGNGTITLYNVPKRWDSVPDIHLEENYMKNYTQSLLDNAKSASVPVSTAEKVEKLINIQIIH